MYFRSKSYTYDALYDSTAFVPPLNYVPDIASLFQYNMRVFMGCNQPCILPFSVILSNSQSAYFLPDPVT